MVSYLEEMLIFHSSLDEYIIDVRSMLETLHKFGMTIRPTRKFVATGEVTFLGFVIRQGQIMPEPRLIEKIMSIKQPAQRDKRDHYWGY